MAAYGKQSSGQSVVELASGWADRNQKEFLEKLNCLAEHVRIKTGITLGGVPSHSTGYESEDKAERDYMQGIAKRKSASFAEMFPVPVQQFYDSPGDRTGEKFNNAMDAIKGIDWRGSG